MPTKSILLSMFLAMTSMCMAQVRISTSDLNGTKWRIKNSPQGHYVYTAKKQIWYDEDGDSHSYPYYLTDQPIYSYEGSLFDHSKVGKGTKGCYKVIYVDVSDVIFCYSIEQFDKEKGVMACKMVSKECFGSGTVIDYVLIK
ncbi:MAG: hypothetical protein ACI3Y5_07785 [Prevotella sp.]